MAKTIFLKHKESGLSEIGIFGWSWTTLFFGPFPALFRGDVLIFFVALFIYLLSIPVCFTGLGLILSWAGHLWWCSYYNNFYTRRLLNEGYRLVGTAEQVHIAASKLKRDDEEHAAFINNFSDSSVSLSVGLRKCPFCAEQVKAEAIVCRFCHKDLPLLEAAKNEAIATRADTIDCNRVQAHEQQQLLDRLGVERKDGLFYYQGKSYSSLSDIPFGKEGD
jgi:hypothetical protein